MITFENGVQWYPPPSTPQSSVSSRQDSRYDPFFCSVMHPPADPAVVDPGNFTHRCALTVTFGLSWGVTAGKLSKNDTLNTPILDVGCYNCPKNLAKNMPKWPHQA